MKIQVLSDVHTEFHRDLGISWIKSLDPEGVDVLIVAGDLGVKECLDHVLMALCAIFPHVVYVLGNHEYYKHSPREVHAEMARLAKRHPNLHWLHNTSVVIDGVSFFGTPLWFREDPFGAVYERNMADFSVIRDFKPWVYEENKRAISALRAVKADVVVTHHLPHPQSISSFFKGSPLNRFFLCDVRQEMAMIEPQLWVHGHTHGPRDYTFGPTRVVCNPMGYPHEGNSKFIDKLVIEINSPTAKNTVDAAPQDLRPEGSTGDDAVGGEDS